MTTVDRILRLERDNRRMRAAALAVAVVAAGLTLVGARGEKAPPDELVAREFVLVDTDDRPRARLSSSRGSVKLVLYDDTGTSRVILRHRKAGVSELCLLDGDAKIRKRFAVDESRELKAGGKAAASSQSLAEVERECLQRLAGDASDVVTRVRLGNLYYDTDRPKLAIPVYEEALRQRPDDANVRVDLATCWKRVGELDKAREMYKAVLEKQPTHLQANFNLAVVLELQEKWERAATYWDRAADAAPDEATTKTARDYAEKAREKAKKKGL